MSTLGAVYNYINRDAHISPPLVLGLRLGSRLGLRLGDVIMKGLRRKNANKQTFTSVIFRCIIKSENILILSHLNDGVLIDWYSIFNLPLIRTINVDFSLLSNYSCHY